MTYMLLLNCALQLVEEIILYYDARSKKHKKTSSYEISTKRKNSGVSALLLTLYFKVANNFKAKN